MNDFANTLTRWVVRIALLMAGAVFFLCLLAIVSVLAMVWGARALWAKLTGRPVTPWVMPMMRTGANWATYRAGAWGNPMGGAAAAAAAGPAASAEPADIKRGGVLASVARDITDVQPREVRE